VKFCDEHNPPDAYYTKISYEELITRGMEAIHDSENSQIAGISFNDNEDMCEAMRENRQEFWKNWSLVTGVAVPTDAHEKIRVHCGC